MMSVDLYQPAGRSAYLAAFHAAQALISEHTGRAIKTHRGVHTEFQRLTRNDPAFDADLRAFLSRSYELKAIADYGTDPHVDISAAQALEAIGAADRFVEQVTTMIAKHADRST